MPIRIDRDDVERLLGEGAQIVDVLPAEEFGREHIRGAISIPLKQLDARTIAPLDRSRPVIVYCWDNQCDLSPRAAARLESLGFNPVFDYAAGEMDWLAFGLPTEGTQAGRLRAGTVCRRDVPVCRLTDFLEDVQFRTRRAEWETCIVVDDDGVVLGRLDRDALTTPAEDRIAEAVMIEGPSSVRPSEYLNALVERMDAHGVERMLVTTSLGTLVGDLTLADAKAALERH